MATAVKLYLVDEDVVLPLAAGALAGLRAGRRRLPRYAGRTLHIMALTVALQDRKPVSVAKVAAETLPLDDQGRAKSQLLDQLRASAHSAKAKRAWAPSPGQIARATALACGRVKSKHRPI